MPIGYQYLIGFGIGIATAIFLYFQSNRRITYHHNVKPGAQSFVEEPESPCPICREEMDNNSIQYLKCLHGLHTRCWLDLKRLETSPKCPICRMEL